MRKLLKNQKGFTLVELLAVIVILGVIAAIAVPSIGNVIESSKEKADLESVKLLEDAAMMYIVGENVTPDNEDDVTVTNLNSKGYLKEIPKHQSGENAGTNMVVEATYDTATKKWEITVE